MSLRAFCIERGFRRVSRCVVPTTAALLWIVCAHLDQPAHAQGMFDLFGGGGSGDIFGAPQAPAGPGSSSSEDGSEHRRRRSKHSKKHASDDGESPGGSGYTSICVRTCDGYTFPVGEYRGFGDRAAHEATCRSQCPDAATALYLRPSQSDAIEEATRVDDGQSYSKLPAAFKFKSEHSAACTCYRAGGRKRFSFARDYTLRRGDVVMMNDGLKVFHGGAFPFRANAFSPLLQSRDVARKDLAVFEAMNRARLRADTTSRELTVTPARRASGGARRKP